jgi:hypothetical protein
MLVLGIMESTLFMGQAVIEIGDKGHELSDALREKALAKHLTPPGVDNVCCKLYGIGPSRFGTVRCLARQRFLPFRGQ